MTSLFSSQLYPSYSKSSFTYLESSISTPSETKFRMLVPNNIQFRSKKVIRNSFVFGGDLILIFPYKKGRMNYFENYL